MSRLLQAVFFLFVFSSTLPANDAETAAILYREGNLSLRLGNNEEALKSFQESFRIYERLGHKTGMASNLNNIAYIYRVRGNYNEALHQYNRSLKLSKESGDKAVIASTLNNIGKIHEAKGEFKQALSRYEEALSVLKDAGETDLEARIRNNARLLQDHIRKVQAR